MQLFIKKKFNCPHISEYRNDFLILIVISFQLSFDFQKVDNLFTKAV